MTRGIWSSREIDLPSLPRALALRLKLVPFSLQGRETEIGVNYRAWMDGLNIYIPDWQRGRRLFLDKVGGIQSLIRGCTLFRIVS